MDPTKTHILMLKEPDEEAELEFEVEYHLSLSIQQRLDLMLQMSRYVAESVARSEGRRYGPGEPTQIAKH